MQRYPKRLIEVDLPIRRISAHARREKSIRHGHISTLHIWWARRPLAACRAVICASLWPDPVDELCPQAFRDAAAEAVNGFSRAIRESETVQKIMAEYAGSFLALEKAPIDATKPDHWNPLRYLLLDFIAEFAVWEASTEPHFLETSRKLTQAAHEALGGQRGTRPLVVDPFAGGGSIPLEALRVGADAFASDLNPVAVLLNKVVLEYIPKYGQRLADEVHKWGQWVKEEAEKELAEFYPKDADGATPIAYLWARTITCEGPGCGAEIPLMRSLWLAKKSGRSIALKMMPNTNSSEVDFVIARRDGKRWSCTDAPRHLAHLVGEVVENVDPGNGTVQRGSATCPCCGYTTSAKHVRLQFRGRHGGADDARLISVTALSPETVGRIYRLPSELQLDAVQAAKAALDRLLAGHKGHLSLIPDEELPYLRSIFNIQLLDVTSWGQLYSSRQLLSLATLTALVNNVGDELGTSTDAHFAAAVQTVLAFMVDKQADLGNSLCPWEPVAECPRHLFGRQAIGIVWDFAEGVATSDSSGGWSVQASRTAHILQGLGHDWAIGSTDLASATHHPLPDDSVSAFITDPPYYDAVPYADLSDFFYVWLRRSLGHLYPHLFSEELTPKREEAVQLAERNPKYSYKTKEYFEAQMVRALAEGRRLTVPNGIGIVVFAHKTTAAWETMLQAVIDAGWVVQASWPIDTEMGSRLRAMNSAVLASSIHLVCRPRENPDGSLRTDDIGDWRDVLRELPERIHEWLPRLADEGVVGADAIFACLGPALEIFSRYSSVEKASGEVVPLREYLEHVWAAVSKEALTLVFAGADTTGFEEDARLTAIWLWTITGGGMNGRDEDEEGDTVVKSTGYTLEYDAARKIAQGLGCHLEQLNTLVEVKGDKATLLPVSQRTKALFGKDAEGPKRGRKKKSSGQMDMFKTLDEVEAEDGGWTDTTTPSLGKTVLDQIHQTMILFAAGRSEAMKRFLVDEATGTDPRFWSLAQALSALYPPNTDEKRWVDGVLARKKGLGFS